MSHFNAATPLDSALFSVMGATIVVVWLATAWIGVLLMRQHLADRATAWAVRLGLAIALGGLAIGFLMTSPRSEQLAETAPAALGAHSVGVADGGPGLPLVNWSTEGGDLRAGHFIGMHALQAIPLFALALAFAGRRIGRLRDERRRTHLIAVAASGYAGLTALVTWQALRGQSLVHPDALTLGVAMTLVAAVAIAALLILARPNGRPDLPQDPAAPVDFQKVRG